MVELSFTKLSFQEKAECLRKAKSKLDPFDGFVIDEFSHELVNAAKSKRPTSMFSETDALEILSAIGRVYLEKYTTRKEMLGGE